MECDVSILWRNRLVRLIEWKDLLVVMKSVEDRGRQSRGAFLNREVTGCPVHLGTSACLSRYLSVHVSPPRYHCLSGTCMPAETLM